MLRVRMLWLLLLLLVSGFIGDSLIIYLYSMNFVFVVGLLKCLVPELLSLSGLRAGWILPIGLLLLPPNVQDHWDLHREELGAVPPDLVLVLMSASVRSCVDEFWNVWCS